MDSSSLIVFGKVEMSQMKLTKAVGGGCDGCWVWEGCGCWALGVDVGVVWRCLFGEDCRADRLSDPVWWDSWLRLSSSVGLCGVCMWVMSMVLRWSVESGADDVVVENCRGGLVPEGVYMSGISWNRH